MFSTECFFSALAQANAVSIAEYMADLARYYQELGYVKLVVFLDRNSTHLLKMRTQYQKLSSGFSVAVEFVHFATYSPALNPVEYLIHWVRQHSLHQADCKQTLAEVKQRLVSLLDHKSIFSFDQVVNILSHIERLVEGKQKVNLSP